MNSDIYQMEERPFLVHTAHPPTGAIKVHETAPVFLARAPMRPRPLVDRYGALYGTIRSKLEAQTVIELIAGAGVLGYKPLAAVDGRYFFHKDPDSIHELFGTGGDWLRLGVYFKRPGITKLTITSN